MSRDRAASEVLGYVIIFGIILTSVLLLSASGTGALEDIRDDEQSANAQRAFDVVADNMAAVYERNSPSRATEIDVGNSRLYYGNYTTIEIEVEDSSGAVERFEEELRPVVLSTSAETDLVYEGGAVFQTEREGGTMLREPPLLLSRSRVHAPIVKTTSPTVEAVSGTTALLRGKSTERDVLFTPQTLSNPDELRVSITSPRYEIWQRYFEEETPMSCTAAGPETVECSMSSPGDVYVTLQEIELSIIL